MTRKAPDETTAEIARLYAEGVQLKDIATAVGMSIGSVRRWTRRLGCEHRRRPGRTEHERFTESAQRVEAGCVVWTKLLKPEGYGYFEWTAPDGTKCSNAHRYSYTYSKGPIPPGSHIDHLCRNRACVNPDHLEAVTPRENLLRGIGPSALNAVKTHCLRGHPFDAENTFWHRGARSCRTCRRASANAYQARKRTAV